MRVHYVGKARAARTPRRCISCGHEVQPGESYKRAEPRYGPVLIWCHSCSPRPSQMTSSKLSAVYAAQEDFASEIGSLDNATDIEAALATVAEAAEEVAQEYQDSIDAMPESLQEGPTGEEMREKIDALEEYAQDLQAWSSDDDDPREDDEEDPSEDDIETYLESMRSSAQDAVDSLDL